jgi:hypothetical protein
MTTRSLAQWLRLLSLGAAGALLTLPAVAQPASGDPGLYTSARLVSSSSAAAPSGAPRAGAATPSRAATAAAVTPAATPVDTFEGFLRYPAEEQFFIAMDATNPIGYFRDFFSGGETFSDGANDGDSLSATFTPQGGPTSTFIPVVFHSTYNGQQDCWVGGFPPVALCGSQAIDITWYANTQCGPTIGAYTMTFTRNGNAFATGTFHIKPTINPDKLTAITAPTYNQGNYPTTQYGNFCYDPAGRTRLCSRVITPTNPNPPQATISQLGCLLTAYSATLTYHGVPTAPTDLNAWLKDPANDGFGSGGDIRPWKVVAYAKSQGVNLTFSRQPATESPTGDTLFPGNTLAGAARSAICAKGLTPIKVKHHTLRNPQGSLHTHFVAAWGRPDTEDSYKLKDPNGGADRDLASATIPYDYSGNYYGTRELEGTGTTFSFPGNVTLTLHSPAELLLTDASGLRTGIDPVGNASYAEIPGATYNDDSFDDPNDDTGAPASVDAKVLELTPGAAGTYSLTVTGTGIGTYDLELTALDPTFQKTYTTLEDVPISTGAQQVYSFTLPVTPGGAFPLGGGFDGGGQRPRDVNHFLSYANPSSDHTALPAGTTTFPLLIFYDPRVIPATFAATLNGADASALFHPAAGAFERVDLPLLAGSNVLKLSIDGNLPTRVATDSDRLVFSVP